MHDSLKIGLAAFFFFFFQKVRNERGDTAVLFDGLIPGSLYEVEVFGTLQESITSPSGHASHTMGGCWFVKKLWRLWSELDVGFSLLIILCCTVDAV